MTVIQYASQWPTTLRCPDDKGVSHPEWANEQLESRHQFNYTTNQTTYASPWSLRYRVSTAVLLMINDRDTAT